MAHLTYGRGTEEQFGEYLELINLVFGYTNTANSFDLLLPKLYQPELKPAYNSFNAYKDGKMVAAIGSFPLATQVLDVTLKGMGIGNVAVHPDHRREGHMKAALNMSIRDMIDQGVDFSCLGGQRQRYNYFSYEYAGPCYHYHIGPGNLKYFYSDTPLRLTMEEVTREDQDALDAIAALNDAQPCHPVRDRKYLYAILTTWHAKPYIFRDNGKFAGYCVLSEDGGAATELLAVEDGYVIEMVRAICAATGKDVSVTVPPFKTGYRRALEDKGHSVSTGCCEMFSILCYRRVLEAYLKLKATYCRLAEGSVTVLVHGKAGDEQLEITVSGGEVSVRTTQKAPEVELEHLDAMRFFFAPVCSLRDTAPAAAQSWFPVPLWSYSADAV